MFKIGDIARFIGDDDEYLVMGVGLECREVAYCLLDCPHLVSGDKLKLIRPSRVDQAFTAGDKVQYFAYGQLYPHPETFTIDSVMIAHDTEQDKDVPMYDIVGEFGTELYQVEQQYLQRIQTNYTLF